MSCLEQKSCIDCPLHARLREGKVNHSEISSVIITGEIKRCRDLAHNLLIQDVREIKK